ncbi:hypothetical protein [Halomonas korlensis]|uniref:Uncharacterized protein n=1 Tax=Halomonas korlensis TaxID=463301 RepID=A0A1I7KM06_9GAMM|nr:hypothetical protein [Halomonas korlensis]SFU98441.1 hypothetical protein SAMN04487955_1267 [Halomonas korlensis]
MPPQYSISPMSAGQLNAFMAILEEFSDERLTPAILILAYRLACLEVS